MAWLSAIEVLWCLIKKRFRATPASARGSPHQCIEFLRGLLKRVRDEPTLLLYLFLPSWRWACVVVLATFTGKRVLCKGRRIILPELHRAAMNYKQRLDRGEEEQVHVDASFVNL